jgi:hypothetical protein
MGLPGAETEPPSPPAAPAAAPAAEGGECKDGAPPELLGPCERCKLSKVGAVLPEGVSCEGACLRDPYIEGTTDGDIISHQLPTITKQTHKKNEIPDQAQVRCDKVFPVCGRCKRLDVPCVPRLKGLKDGAGGGTGGGGSSTPAGRGSAVGGRTKRAAISRSPLPPPPRPLPLVRGCAC